MTKEKFIVEVDTLKKFFAIFCHGKKHNDIKLQKVNLNFEGEKFEYEVELCDECFKLLNYSFEKLQKCPHDTKPRCRTCTTPCYEPYQWKKVAKVMRYAGIQQGLNKVKKFFINE